MNRIKNDKILLTLCILFFIGYAVIFVSAFSELPLNVPLWHQGLLLYGHFFLKNAQKRMVHDGMDSFLALVYSCALGVFSSLGYLGNLQTIKKIRFCSNKYLVVFSFYR